MTQTMFLGHTEALAGGGRAGFPGASRTASDTRRPAPRSASARTAAAKDLAFNNPSVSDAGIDIDDEDPTSAGRGLAFGLLLSVSFWAIVGTLGYWIV